MAVDKLSYPGAMFHAMEQTTTERTAAAIRAELARRGLTHQELGKALEWSRTTTWRRLQGVLPLDIDELDAVADFLGVPVTTLLTDRDAA